MQHHPNTTNITTHHIQQYLDENKALILNILENQNSGKFSECAENQTRLQHNLMYLAAIADCQPKSSPIHLQQLQVQQMVQNSHMAAQSQTVFPQQQPFTMSQLGSGPTMEGLGSGVFPDFNFGEIGSHGVVNGRQESFFKAKENRITEGVLNFPQKKGKLTTN